MEPSRRLEPHEPEPDEPEPLEPPGERPLDYPKINKIITGNTREVEIISKNTTKKTVI